VILPAGTWSISAIANFYDGRACEGPVREITATVNVISEQ
jgi:hypothetical protein